MKNTSKASSKCTSNTQTAHWKNPSSTCMMIMGQSRPWTLKKVKKMKQEWSILDPMVDLFEKIEEVVKFAEAANTPIPGGEVVNISNLLMLRTRGI